MLPLKSTKHNVSLRLRSELGSRGRMQGGKEGGKVRKDGRTNNREVQDKKEILRFLLYPSTLLPYLSIYLSPPLAFKTSVLLTLIAWCHIFIPRKALEKPLSGWGK